MATKMLLHYILIARSVIGNPLSNSEGSGAVAAYKYYYTYFSQLAEIV